MLHFNRNDIHEWNISKEAFDAMIKDYGFKVDESKISIEALYTNALANFRNDSEKTFKFLKQEKSTAEEIRDRSFEEKTKIENFFTNALMIEVAKLIDETAVKIQVHAEHLKRTYLEFNDYMVRKSQEEASKLQANISLQEAGIRLMQDQQRALEEYKTAVGDKISNMKSELGLIRKQKEELKSDYDKVLNESSNQSFEEIKNLKNKDGKSYYDGIPEDKAKAIHKALLEGDILAERAAKQKMEHIDDQLSDTRNEIKTLEKAVHAQRAGVLFEKGSDGIVSLSLNGYKKSGALQNRLEQLKAREASLESQFEQCKFDIRTDALERRAAIAQLENVDINLLPPAEALAAAQNYEATSARLNRDLDSLAALEAREEAIMADAKELEAELRDAAKINPDIDTSDSLADMNDILRNDKKDFSVMNESSVRARS